MSMGPGFDPAKDSIKKTPTTEPMKRPVSAYQPSAQLLRSNFDKVKVFHKTFNHPVREKPGLPLPAERLLRVKVLVEEVLEFAQASGVALKCEIGAVSDNESDCNLIEAADALADIEYVTHGAALVWGIPSQQVFDEVQRSNMSKLGADGKPVYREDGKILKGPNYSPPNIGKILGGK